MKLINKLNFALLDIARKYANCNYFDLNERDRQIVLDLASAGYLAIPDGTEIELTKLAPPKLPELPWRVEYNQRCEEWDPKSCPRVVSSDGKFIVGIPQSDDVHHPGEYDRKADAIAHLIVNSVNKNV